MKNTVKVKVKAVKKSEVSSAISWVAICVLITFFVTVCYNVSTYGIHLYF